MNADQEQADNHKELSRGLFLFWSAIIRENPRFVFS